MSEKFSSTKLRAFARQAVEVLAVEGGWNARAMQKMGLVADRLGMTQGEFESAVDSIPSLVATVETPSRYELAYETWTRKALQGHEKGGFLAPEARLRAIQKGVLDFQLDDARARVVFDQVAKGLGLGQFDRASMEAEVLNTVSERFAGRTFATVEEFDRLYRLGETWGLRGQEMNELIDKVLSANLEKQYWNRTRRIRLVLGAIAVLLIVPMLVFASPLLYWSRPIASSESVSETPNTLKHEKMVSEVGAEGVSWRPDDRLRRLIRDEPELANVLKQIEGQNDNDGIALFSRLVVKTFGLSPSQAFELQAVLIEARPTGVSNSVIETGWQAHLQAAQTGRGITEALNATLWSERWKEPSGPAFAFAENDESPDSENDHDDADHRAGRSLVAQWLVQRCDTNNSTRSERAAVAVNFADWAGLLFAVDRTRFEKIIGEVPRTLMERMVLEAAFEFGDASQTLFKLFAGRIDPQQLQWREFWIEAAFRMEANTGDTRWLAFLAYGDAARLPDAAKREQILKEMESLRAARLGMFDRYNAEAEHALDEALRIASEPTASMAMRVACAVNAGNRQLLGWLASRGHAGISYSEVVDEWPAMRMALTSKMGDPQVDSRAADGEWTRVFLRLNTAESLRDRVAVFEELSKQVSVRRELAHAESESIAAVVLSEKLTDDRVAVIRAIPAWSTNSSFVLQLVDGLPASSISRDECQSLVQALTGDNFQFQDESKWLEESRQRLRELVLQTLTEESGPWARESERQWTLLARWLLTSYRWRVDSVMAVKAPKSTEHEHAVFLLQELGAGIQQSSSADAQRRLGDWLLALLFESSKLEKSIDGIGHSIAGQMLSSELEWARALGELRRSAYHQRRSEAIERLPDFVKEDDR